MSVLETEDFTIRRIEAGDARKLRYAVMDNRVLLEDDFPNVVSRYMHEETAQKSVERAVAATLDASTGFSAWVATDPDNNVAYGLASEYSLSPSQRRALRVIKAWNGSEYGGLLGVHSLVDASLIAGWTSRNHPETLPVQGLEFLLQDTRGLKAGEVALSVTLIRPENTAAINVARRAGMTRAQKRNGIAVPLISSARQRCARLGDGINEPRGLWVHATTGAPL